MGPNFHSLLLLFRLLWLDALVWRFPAGMYVFCLVFYFDLISSATIMTGFSGRYVSVLRGPSHSVKVLYTRVRRWVSMTGAWWVLLLLAILFLFLLSVTGMTGLAGRSVIRCMCMYFLYLFHFMWVFAQLLRLVYLVITGCGVFNLLSALFCDCSRKLSDWYD